MKAFFRGAGYFMQGFRLIRRPGLRRFVLVPLLINLLLFGGLLWAAVGWVQALSQYLMGWLPAWLDWLSVLLWPLFGVLGLVLVFYTFSTVANFIASPFNGLLAEAVERQLRGEVMQSGWKELLRDIVPSLLSELRKLLYFLLRALPLGILFLIPVVNLAAPFLWFLFSAWMLALQYVDYPAANNRLFFAEQRRRLRRRPLVALGFGSTALLFTLIPVINFLVMPVAVAGATALWVNEQGLGQVSR